MLQVAIDHSQECVTGTVRLKLYKGSASVVGRASALSLYSKEHVAFRGRTTFTTSATPPASSGSTHSGCDCCSAAIECGMRERGEP